MLSYYSLLHTTYRARGQFDAQHVLAHSGVVGTEPHERAVTPGASARERHTADPVPKSKSLQQRHKTRDSLVTNELIVKP